MIQATRPISIADRVRAIFNISEVSQHFRRELTFPERRELGIVLKRLDALLESATALTDRQLALLVEKQICEPLRGLCRAVAGELDEPAHSKLVDTLEWLDGASGSLSEGLIERSDLVVTCENAGFDLREALAKGASAGWAA